MTEAPRPKPVRGQRFLDTVERVGPLDVTVLASCVPPSAPAGAPEPSGELPAYRCDDGHTFAGTPVCEDCGVSARQLEPDHRRMLAALKRVESAEAQLDRSKRVIDGLQKLGNQLLQRTESAESESDRLRAQLQAVRGHVMTWANHPPENADARARVAMDRIYDLLTTTGDRP